MVDAAPAAWQLTDLAERGWPASRLATRLCVNPHTVSAIRDGRHAQTSIAIAQRIKRLHRELLNIDPVTVGVRPTDAARARNRAARRAGANRPQLLPGPGKDVRTTTGLRHPAQTQAA
jgi:hypothetical protein